MRTVFEADDGTSFAEEGACILYEMLTHSKDPETKKIIADLFVGCTSRDNEGYDLFYVGSSSQPRFVSNLVKLIPKLADLHMKAHNLRNHVEPDDAL